jgi:transposase
LRWALLKDGSKLSRKQAMDLDRLVIQFTTKRTARAWLYREQLRNILDRKQINVVSTMLAQWCADVTRSKVESMKDVAAMICNHFDGIVAWARSRQTSGFIEVLNGLFQAAKRKARSYTRFRTMKRFSSSRWKTELLGNQLPRGLTHLKFKRASEGDLDRERTGWLRMQLHLSKQKSVQTSR